VRERCTEEEDPSAVEYGNVSDTGMRQESDNSRRLEVLMGTFPLDLELSVWAQWTAWDAASCGGDSPPGAATAPRYCCLLGGEYNSSPRHMAANSFNACLALLSTAVHRLREVFDRTPPEGGEVHVTYQLDRYRIDSLGGTTSRRVRVGVLVVVEASTTLLDSVTPTPQTSTANSQLLSNACQACSQAPWSRRSEGLDDDNDSTEFDARSVTEALRGAQHLAVVNEDVLHNGKSLTRKPWFLRDTPQVSTAASHKGAGAETLTAGAPTTVSPLLALPALSCATSSRSVPSSPPSDSALSDSRRRLILQLQRYVFPLNPAFMGSASDVSTTDFSSLASPQLYSTPGQPPHPDDAMPPTPTVTAPAISQACQGRELCRNSEPAGTKRAGRWNERQPPAPPDVSNAASSSSRNTVTSQALLSLRGVGHPPLQPQGPPTGAYTGDRFLQRSCLSLSLEAKPTRGPSTRATATSHRSSDIPTAAAPNRICPSLGGQPHAPLAVAVQRLEEASTHRRLISTATPTKRRAAARVTKARAERSPSQHALSLLRRRQTPLTQPSRVNLQSNRPGRAAPTAIPLQANRKSGTLHPQQQPLPQSKYGAAPALVRPRLPTRNQKRPEEDRNSSARPNTRYRRSSATNRPTDLSGSIPSSRILQTPPSTALQPLAKHHDAISGGDTRRAGETARKVR